MDWSQQFFIYCERGADPSFWAEPFNAISNGAFLVAAALAARRWSQSATRGVAELALIAIVGVIGVGSFLFHTFATRWAVIFDVGPIGCFMLVYLIYALRWFLAAPWWIVALGAAAFLLSAQVIGLAPCASGLLPITEAAGRPCYNGSLAYAPALFALCILTALLIWRQHSAVRSVGWATIALALSITLRTVDLEVCAFTDLLGRARGTHALWHLLNATVLYLLLMAAIEHGAAPAETKVRPAH